MIGAYDRGETNRAIWRRLGGAGRLRANGRRREEKAWQTGGRRHMTASGDLLQALFQRLRSDASLSALLGGAGLLEQPADNVAFPYVTCGQTSAFDWDTGADNNADQLVTLHVWSKAFGDAETHAIMDSIKARLADAALAIGPRGQTRLSLEFAEDRYDEDLAVHHGLLRFRAITQENA